MVSTDSPKDKVAVVTGAAGGLRWAIALTLAGYGARVVACNVNRKGLDTLQSELQALGGSPPQLTRFWTE